MNTTQPTKEPILYTEEEIKNLCRESYYHGRNDELDEKETHTKKWPDVEFDNWFEQNKKK